jgi:hypothetical protein
MKDGPAYPNVSIQVDGAYFEMWSATMSCEELGLFVRKLFSELSNGNFEYADQ